MLVLSRVMLGIAPLAAMCAPPPMMARCSGQEALAKKKQPRRQACAEPMQWRPVAQPSGTVAVSVLLDFSAHRLEVQSLKTARRGNLATNHMPISPSVAQDLKIRSAPSLYC